MMIGAAVIDKLSLKPGLIIGAALAFCYIGYRIGFILMTDTWAWFAKVQNWTSLVNHLNYGLVGVWAYFRIRDHQL